MPNPRLLICDLGGTLREFRDREQEYPTGTPNEWDLCHGVWQRLPVFIHGGGLLGIATNQPFIESGQTTFAIVRNDIKEVLRRALWTPEQTTTVLDAIGACGVQICPHQPETGCVCRKPQPLMLLKIVYWYQATAGVKLNEVLYVGDELDDYHAARRADIAFAWAQDYFGKA